MTTDEKVDQLVDEVRRLVNVQGASSIAEAKAAAEWKQWRGHVESVLRTIAEMVRALPASVHALRPAASTAPPAPTWHPPLWMHALLLAFVGLIALALAAIALKLWRT